MPTSKVHTALIEGYAAKDPKTPLQPFQYETPSLGPWDIEVEISHCGICHSDLHLIKNDWGFATLRQGFSKASC